MKKYFPKKLAKPVVLVGMMGCGKSAVGAELAELLSVPFLDSDTEIKFAEGMEIAQLFQQFGEAYFREKESGMLEKLLGGRPKILEREGERSCWNGIAGL